MPARIEFYLPNDEYGVFSNFYPSRMAVFGRTWPASEHPFQAMKFATTEPDWMDRIAAVPGPGKAAIMGRDRKHKLRPDWESIKDNVMRVVVLAKFAQNDEFRKILLDTGDAILVEHTANDRYWADGGDGKGKNMLGLILMEIRELFRNADTEEGREAMTQYTLRSHSWKR